MWGLKLPGIGVLGVWPPWLDGFVRVCDEVRVTKRRVPALFSMRVVLRSACSAEVGASLSWSFARP
jgi:hypothetical protein